MLARDFARHNSLIKLFFVGLCLNLRSSRNQIPLGHPSFFTGAFTEHLEDQ